MAYRLKSIRYHGRTDCYILLQNENGPCPLLAAANALLLKGIIRLPTNCIGGRVVTIEELINVLAERILTNNTNSTNINSQHHIQEVLDILPSLQHGMDVNPKFTSGPLGIEYTKQLNAFDLLHVELVHGWLLEKPPVIDSATTSATTNFLNSHDTTTSTTNASIRQEYELVHNQTYNQLINQVIKGNEASAAIERALLTTTTTTTSATTTTTPTTTEHQKQSASSSSTTSSLTVEQKQQYQDDLTKGNIIHIFLERTSHQLTQYGLQTLYEHLKPNDVVVFFRNNHFNTLTKHTDNILYLLVTDLGYADVDTVIWEKLDVIDGDTEYVTAEFTSPPPYLHTNRVSSAATGEQLLANSQQSQADYQLALQLSRETSASANANTATTTTTTTTPAASSSSIQPTTAILPPISSLMSTSSNTQQQQQSSSAVGSSNDSQLEAARQASLVDYSMQQQQQQQQQQLMPNVAVGIPNVAVGIPATVPPTSSQPQQTQQQSQSSTITPATDSLLEAQDRMLALQLQQDNSDSASHQLALQLQQETSDSASHQLALQLQQQEEQELQQRRREQQRRAYTSTAPPPRQQPTASGGDTKDNSGCIIS